MNNKTTIGIIAGLLIILGLVWWSLSGGQKSANLTDTDTDITPGTGQDTMPASLTVNHYFVDGSHTIEGTITLPTPCDSLSHSVTVAESFPEQVRIAFVTKKGEGLCTQVLADKFFRIVFDASKDATITATLDGRPLTLIYAQNKEGITK